MQTSRRLDANGGVIEDEHGKAVDQDEGEESEARGEGSAGGLGESVRE